MGWFLHFAGEHTALLAEGLGDAFQLQHLLAHTSREVLRHYSIDGFRAAVVFVTRIQAEKPGSYDLIR